jgi:hypothetical protein
VSARGTLPLVLLACAVCVGCGASDRAPDAAATVERFQAALDHRDGEAACAELSAQTVSKLEQQEQRPCEEAIFEVKLPRGVAVGHASVYIPSATVSLGEGDALFLDEAPDGWEISAAGCRPTGPDLPYDCELED